MVCIPCVAGLHIYHHSLVLIHGLHSLVVGCSLHYFWECYVEESPRVIKTSFCHCSSLQIISQLDNELLASDFSSQWPVTTLCYILTSKPAGVSCCEYFYKCRFSCLWKCFMFRSQIDWGVSTCVSSIVTTFLGV